MREPVSSADVAILRLESATNLMVVAGVLTLGRPIELERLQATLQTRLLQFDRFRQRVVYLGEENTPYWEEDPRLDLQYHVQRISLPARGNEAALQDVVSRLIGTPLDPNRPLWQFHLVEPYGQGCAVVCRVHHSVGDGQALVHVLLSLTDAEADAPQPIAPAPRQAVPVPSGPDEPRRHPIRRAGKRLVRRGLRLAAHPSRIVALGRTGTRAAMDIGGLVLLPADPHTVLSGKLGAVKRAAWSAAIPLGSVKAVGQGLGGTVNDVLLAALSGALRRYLLTRGETVDELEIQAAIPVNLRSRGAEGTLGNQVGAIILLLPVWLADPGQRLRVIRQRMDRHKSSLQAELVGAALNLLGFLPVEVESLLVGYFTSRLTAVITNVIGPGERLYLAGAPADSLMVWVPKTGAIGLGVSFLSYAGEIRVGVISDEGLVPDPETIVAGFQAELDALLAQAQAVDGPATVRASLSTLDDALVTLAGLLDGWSEGSVQGADEEPAQCQALTRSGAPCKNRPLPGTHACRIHQPAPEGP
jgi:WS/DGAT/MGAT family acyltransferase